MGDAREVADMPREVGGRRVRVENLAVEQSRRSGRGEGGGGEGGEVSVALRGEQAWGQGRTRR